MVSIQLLVNKEPLVLLGMAVRDNNVDAENATIPSQFLEIRSIGQ